MSSLQSWRWKSSQLGSTGFHARPLGRTRPPTVLSWSLGCQMRAGMVRDPCRPGWPVGGWPSAGLSCRVTG